MFLQSRHTIRPNSVSCIRSGVVMHIRVLHHLCSHLTPSHVTGGGAGSGTLMNSAARGLYAGFSINCKNRLLIRRRSDSMLLGGLHIDNHGRQRCIHVEAVTVGSHELLTCPCSANPPLCPPNPISLYSLRLSTSQTSPSPEPP